MKSTLIIVDLQNDFMPGGALAVTGGDQVVPVINRLIGRFDLVVATQDWHPADHGSFAVNHTGAKEFEHSTLNGLPQVLWPSHCVAGTAGAALVNELDQSRIDRVFHKGTDRLIDSYSGFFDNGHRKATGLGDYLREQGVGDVYVAGLATDYCVKFTALDAVSLGFETYLIIDACRGVNLRPCDVETAISQMQAAGVHLIRSDHPNLD